MAFALFVVAPACSAPPPGRLRTGVDLSLRVSVEERFYPVEGSSARALNRALAANGLGSRGRVTHALTEWRVSWSYVPVRRASACVSARPNVSVEVVTTLPRWVDLHTAPERLVSDWALFIARLRDHEARHQHLALQSSRELLWTLTGLQAPDCDLLQRKAETIAASLRDHYEAQHLGVDEATGYGLRESP